MQLVVAEPGQGSEEVVGLGDDLHVAVLDPVVDHLHVVAGTALADPVAARRAAVHLGRDPLEDLPDMRPGLGIASRHDGRAVACSFLAARDARADEEKPALAELPLPADRVLEVRVAAVDDHVARLEVGNEL